MELQRRRLLFAKSELARHFRDWPAPIACHTRGRKKRREASDAGRITRKRGDTFMGASTQNIGRGSREGKINDPELQAKPKTCS